MMPLLTRLCAAAACGSHLRAIVVANADTKLAFRGPALGLKQQIILMAAGLRHPFDTVRAHNQMLLLEPPDL